MQLTGSQRTLLIILAILWALYFCSQSDGPVHNMGALNESGAEGDMAVEVNEEAGVEVDELPSNTQDEPVAEARAASAHTAALNDKFATRNSSATGNKRVSFADDTRGNQQGAEWEKYFDDNNDVIGSGMSESGEFAPLDANQGAFASFNASGSNKCGSNQDCSPEDLFNPDNYLPDVGETNEDWFDTQYEPVSVKNRHLINVTRPHGMSSIGSSLRNASHDLRPTPACPKHIISPFLNSSIEPDTNIKPW